MYTFVHLQCYIRHLAIKQHLCSSFFLQLCVPTPFPFAECHPFHSQALSTYPPHPLLLFSSCYYHPPHPHVAPLLSFNQRLSSELERKYQGALRDKEGITPEIRWRIVTSLSGLIVVKYTLPQLKTRDSGPECFH